MFALSSFSQAKQDQKYNDWAIELAKSVHNAFVKDQDKPRPRMCWKMNIDLTKPLTNSEGNLDPFDGYATYRILQQRSATQKNALASEIGHLEKIVKQKCELYSSDDPLDLGEALWIAHWFPNEPWS